jgi:hypothetical protein
LGNSIWKIISSLSNFSIDVALNLVLRVIYALILKFTNEKQGFGVMPKLLEALND